MPTTAALVYVSDAERTEILAHNGNGLFLSCFQPLAAMREALLLEHIRVPISQYQDPIGANMPEVPTSPTCARFTNGGDGMVGATGKIYGFAHLSVRAVLKRPNGALPKKTLTGRIRCCWAAVPRPVRRST